MKKNLGVLLICATVSVWAQQTDIVDFKRIEAKVGFEKLTDKKITGELVVTFQMLKDADSVFLDAVNMSVDPASTILFNISYSDNKIWIRDDLKKDSTYVTRFSYETVPRQALYFTGDQVWTQGQGKYTSHWLPSIDDMNDKIEFDLTYVVPRDLGVIANGKLMDAASIRGINFFRYDMQQPMSSYLVAFVAGDFKRTVLTSDSGIPIELYYRPEDSLKAEPTYRYTKEIFDFLENEIGVPYPWQNYKQIPVRDFLYAGMENTTTTIFSEAFVVDSIGFNDRNYVNVNAHELAHQWFGNLVTETSGTHHWLQEGFATYYAHLAEREVFGEDYYYWLLYNSAEQLKALSEEGKGEALVNPKASSLTFYEKGAWALHILRERIGDLAFREAVRNYLIEYQFKNVSTSDFLSEVRKVSNVSIDDWEADWLHQSAFKAEQAYRSLKKSPFMLRFFELSALRPVELSKKRPALINAMDSGNDFLGQEAVSQISEETEEGTGELFRMALRNENLYVRQAAVLSFKALSLANKSDFEKLLEDESYLTIEMALYQLWVAFPESREAYLNQTKHMVGFQNKNIRQLWLALALRTPNYNPSAQPIYKRELINYTSADYSFEIRQKALEYALSRNNYEPEVLDNLVNATVHHNWRFRNDARSLLKQLFGIPEVKQAITERRFSYSEKEQEFLDKNLFK